MIYVICNIHNAVKDLLPHFLTHYSNLKVDSFIFGIRNGESNPMWKETNSICSNHPIQYHLTTAYNGEIDGAEEYKSLDKMRRAFTRQGDWYVPTDLDEFHLMLPEISDYPQLVALCETRGVGSALNRLADRVKEDLSIPPSIDPNIPIYDQFPREIDLTQSVLGAFPEKIILARHDIEVWGGHHNSPATCHPIYGKTLHFKWFGNLWEKEKEKYELYRRKGYPYSEENRKLLEWLTLHNGKLGSVSNT